MTGRWFGAWIWMLPWLALAQDEEAEVAPAGAASPLMYSWIDARGQLHVTDQLMEVPEPQRAEAEQRAARGELASPARGSYNLTSSGSPEPAAAPPASPDPPQRGTPQRPAVKPGTPPPADAAQAPAAPTEQAAPPAEVAPRPSPPSGGERAVWQGRVRQYERQREEARAAIDAAEAEMLRQRTLMPAGFRARMVELEQEITTQQARLDEATQMLNGGLEEEARRAGVPPGWVR